jgi:hypothetical protein
MAHTPDGKRHINKALEVTLRDGLDRLEEFTLGLAYDAGGELFEQLVIEQAPSPCSNNNRDADNKVIPLDRARARHNNSPEKARETRPKPLMTSAKT